VGQAVGWRNYHEQWLSEGFAQYFAALYAQHQRGDELFGSVLRQLRRWGMDESGRAPCISVSAGAHPRESKVFRALVYNKGAAVLHMLRSSSATTRSSAPAPLLQHIALQESRHGDLRTAMETESGCRCSGSSSNGSTV